MEDLRYSESRVKNESRTQGLILPADLKMLLQALNPDEPHKADQPRKAAACVLLRPCLAGAAAAGSGKASRAAK